MTITTIGIDIAKDVFQIHGVNEHGKVLTRKQIRRHEMLKFFVNLPQCLIGMEACGGAHYWSRELTKLGHTVKLMSPQFVKSYVKTNKNDVADAEAKYKVSRNGVDPFEVVLRSQHRVYEEMA